MFMYWQSPTKQEIRKTLKAENKGADKGEISKMVNKRWKALKPSQKKEYEEKAAKDKARLVPFPPLTDIGMCLTYLLVDDNLLMLMAVLVKI
jgi:hypothetical protein